MNSSIDGPLYALAQEMISGPIRVLSGQLSRERNRTDRNEALCAEYVLIAIDRHDFGMAAFDPKQTFTRAHAPHPARSGYTAAC